MAPANISGKELDLSIPKTWTYTRCGVLDCWISPSEQEWIRLRSDSRYDWFYHGTTGISEYRTDAIQAMLRLGFLEGEFE
jgi:hypothetical protein